MQETLHAEDRATGGLLLVHFIVTNMASINWFHKLPFAVCDASGVALRRSIVNTLVNPECGQVPSQEHASLNASQTACSREQGCRRMKAERSIASSQSARSSISWGGSA